jgi:hypothetical protein
MLTTEARLRQLVRRGIPPEAAAQLVAYANQDGLLAPDATELLAETSAADQEQGRLWVLYSPIFPDVTRRLWSAPEYPYAT